MPAAAREGTCISFSKASIVAISMKLVGSSNSNTLLGLVKSIAMRHYPNAQFFVYGHSLGSMNGQYADQFCRSDE